MPAFGKKSVKNFLVIVNKYRNDTIINNNIIRTPRLTEILNFKFKVFINIKIYVYFI